MNVNHLWVCPPPGWERAAYRDLAPGQTVATVNHRTGKVMAYGPIDRERLCKDHRRMITALGRAVARSDYPYIIRKTSTVQTDRTKETS